MFLLNLFFLIVSNAQALELSSLLTNSLDPRLEYRTLETENFRIHYPLELEDAAFDIQSRVEGVGKRIESLIGWGRSSKTNIVVYPKSDDPGVFTIVHPHAQVFYDIASPPQESGLNDYSDWHEWILTHELTHVAHLESRSLLGKILGSWANPNSVMPAWAKEGLAVYVETTMTNRGRGTGSFYGMLARMAVYDKMLETPGFFSKDTIASFDNKDWPWTVRPYVAGFFLIREMAEQDPQALRRFVQEGTYSLDRLWDATLDHLKRDAEKEIARIRKQPVTNLEYITDSGYYVQGLRFSPDGKSLAFTRDRPEVPNVLMKFDFDGEKRTGPFEIVSRSTGSQVSFSKSSRFLVYDQIGRSRHYYYDSDLYIYDFKEQAIISGSSGYNARDVDVHPDGLHLVFVQNFNGRNRILESDSSFQNLTEVVTPPGFERLSSPRYSSDGKSVLFTIHNSKTGGEDIYLNDGTSTYAIIEDGALNFSPSWTPDGKHIVYVSDKSGVSNVYALEVATYKSYQLSNVLGGLYYPAVDPSGKWIYVSSYRGKGFDIARFSWKPDSWRFDKSYRPRQVNWKSPSLVSENYDKDADPYSSWRYILPQYMRPSMILQRYTQQYGVAIGATDPLYINHYELDVRYDTSSELAVGNLFYYYGGWPWALDWKISRDANLTPSMYTGLSVVSSETSLNIPLDPNGPHVHLRPGIVVQSTFADTAYVGGHLGFRYDTRFREIGTSFYEDGSYLDVDVKQLRPTSGAKGPSNSVQASIESHLPLGLERQTLHLQLEIGTALAGEDGPNSFFSLGGRESFPYKSPNSFTLYGFAPDLFQSSSVALGTAQLTFSLKDIQRGLGEFPFYFGRLSGGLQGQVGSIQFRNNHVVPASFGTELYQDIILSNTIDLTARFGIYQGTREQGGDTVLLFTIAADSQ